MIVGEHDTFWLAFRLSAIKGELVVTVLRIIDRRGSLDMFLSSNFGFQQPSDQLATDGVFIQQCSLGAADHCDTRGLSRCSSAEKLPAARTDSGNRNVTERWYFMSVRRKPLITDAS